MPDPALAYTMLRRKQVEAATGLSRSSIYVRMAQGLWPKPVRLGPRMIGWPASEVLALHEARCLGQSDEAIAALVVALERMRTRRSA